MFEQRESGMLLSLCSKNNPEDVCETFRAHPEMPLRLKHFAATRLNWEPKSANLRSLADELGLGTDSFILVDNSATECAEVQAGCPEVLAIALPAATEFAAFLKHIWAFDRWSITEADRQRAASYAQEAERTKVQRQSANLSEFLASLNLDIRFTPMLPEHLPRVAQLTERTNQMNFTLDPPERGRNSAPVGFRRRRVPHGRRERPFWKLRSDGSDPVSGHPASAHGGFVSVELPSAGTRRGAPHAGAAWRDRSRARAGRSGRSFCFVTAEPARQRAALGHRGAVRTTHRNRLRFSIPGSLSGWSALHHGPTCSRNQWRTARGVRRLCRDPGPSITLASRVNSANPLKSSKLCARGPGAVRRWDPPVRPRTDLEGQLAEMWATPPRFSGRLAFTTTFSI